MLPELGLDWLPERIVVIKLENGETCTSLYSISFVIHLPELQVHHHSQCCKYFAEPVVRIAVA